MFLPGLEEFAPCADLGLDDLAAAPERAAFFDIETEGLGVTARVTMIACLLGGRLEIFERGGNLDGFLARIEEASLLVSFNGATFDEPRLLDHFRIPRLPRPHLDLRKTCKARGLTGGLKKIERAVGILRPADISGMSGEDADWMWRAWEKDRDEAIHTRLLRYCAADVVALELLAHHLLGRPIPASPWALLDAMPPPVEPPEPAAAPVATVADPNYERLRAHVRKRRAAASEQGDRQVFPI